MVESTVAVVTGGSRGIGRAVVEALLEEGTRVFFCSRRPESVSRAEEELRREWGDAVTAAVVDVRSPDAVEEFVRSVVADAGRIDVVVNNAGIGNFAPVDEIGPGEWRETLETNLSGAFHLIRSAVPGMRERGEGWIVNIVSLAGRHPFAGGAAYNASKFGLLGLSDAAMQDLREDGIRVSAILPGSVDTEFGGGDGDGAWKLVPEDVARAVRDLLRYPERALPSRIEMRPTRTE